MTLLSVLSSCAMPVLNYKEPKGGLVHFDFDPNNLNCVQLTEQVIRVQGIITDLADKLKEQGQRPWHVEGYKSRRWILIDYVDIVVHIFRREAREFYALERLWGDAECTSFEDDLVSTLETDPANDNQFVFSRS